MKELAVVDSTCLIVLAQTNRLALLTALFDPVLIPPAVRREVPVSPPWIAIESPRDAFLVSSLKMLVGDGEAEAIALACEKGCRIVLDDAKARTVAKRMNLKIIGTAGILVRAKLDGIVQSVTPILEDLERNNFYLSADLKKEVLRLCGE